MLYGNLINNGSEFKLFSCFTISRLYFIIHHWWIKRYCYFHSLRFVHRYLSIIIGLLLNVK